MTVETHGELGITPSQPLRFEHLQKVANDIGATVGNQNIGYISSLQERKKT